MFLIICVQYCCGQRLLATVLPVYGVYQKIVPFPVCSTNRKVSPKLLVIRYSLIIISIPFNLGLKSELIFIHFES